MTSPDRPRVTAAAPSRTATRLALTLAAGSAALLAGCEADSYLDPSVVGRWEPTPVTMPILSELDVIDTGDDTLLPVTPVRPADLEPDVQEYTLGSSDVITVTIYELIEPGRDSVYTRSIDETGSIRLPIVGTVRASGSSPSQLESAVTTTLERKGILRDAQVSVVVNQSGQNLFHMVGTPGIGNTRFGTYAIPQPDYRLLEAVAAAGGVTDRTKHVYIIRQTALTPGVAGTGAVEDPASVTAPATSDPESLLDDLLQGGEAPAPAEAPPADGRPAPPAGIDAGLGGDGGSPQYVYVDGQWVAAGAVGPDGRVANALAGETPEVSEELEAELGRMITQRIIEVPYERLLDGDTRFNVVVRPGDIIRVPNENAGFCYFTGQIARGGAYNVPGENRLTLKQGIAAAGGLGPLANPKRVDLVRRIGDDTEATIRLDVKAIYDATQPDIYLKVEDQINIGTSFWAVPLAIVRNGLRLTYGFGFIADRNFGNDIFGAPPRDDGFRR
ncbi:polysaccharide biosynthesis/export family protein [Phycisphaera mikurensis]|uniref:Putative polysaccharide export protein n=1 Tax=Phycisphaera mikurensis (strain NBRC 102666 / KCTC 22515 / FYK2301M01) TaxID=1142394 RepID=I0IGK4_PHYMF|nr:polysaccharide biosynthesis/export family protein [Phycisphaera mikurensis]MBB6442926.1 polysaccharide export outer membrane protein [Phycisphaera mikurensis]BAM04392.1 putative polysaccharide export protein [Phycisphaera mikurensis NBRC 102666]